MPQTLVTRNLQWFLVKSLFSNSLLLTRCELLRQVRRRLPSLYFLKVLLFFSSLLLEETFNFNFYTPFFMGNFCGHLFCFHFTFCLMILYLCIVSFKHNSFWLLLAPTSPYYSHYAANQHGIFSFFLSISRKTPISVVE